MEGGETRALQCLEETVGKRDPRVWLVMEDFIAALMTEVEGKWNNPTLDTAMLLKGSVCYSLLMNENE